MKAVEMIIGQTDAALSALSQYYADIGRGDTLDA